MANAMNYDATTGEYTSKSVSNGSVTPTVQSTEEATQSDPDKDSSVSSAEQEYNEIDYYNLQGELSYIATEETIKIKAGDTVTLSGLGKYLSGNYYMLSVTRTLNSDGYSHSAEVIRVDFGKSVKSSSTSTKEKKEEEKKQPVAKEPEKKTYTVVSGDCLWNISAKFYGSGAKYTKIYDANKGVIGSNPNLIRPGMVLTIP